MHKEESDCLLSSHRPHVLYSMNKLDEHSADSNFFVAAKENSTRTADVFESDCKAKMNFVDNIIDTDATDINMHQPNPAQQWKMSKQSSDSFTDDSQICTFDKSEDGTLFSDSLAISFVNKNTANNWQGTDGIIKWQTDTSPSESLGNDDSYLFSFAQEYTPLGEPIHGFQTCQFADNTKNYGSLDRQSNGE